MIDLSPRKMSIQARYGVAPPRPALAEILDRYVGPAARAEIIQELGRAEARYQRAVKLEAHRRRVERFDRLWEGPIEDMAPRRRKALERSREILARAEDFLEGTWRP